MAVFSKTSLQAARIEPGNPPHYLLSTIRWPWRGSRGGFIELAALDPRQGTIFYTLEQQYASPA